MPFAGTGDTDASSSVQLQVIAGMPVEPSTISLGGITHSDDTSSNKVCYVWDNHECLLVEVISDYFCNFFR